ncbi:MAG: L-seryl-tRNA(Sec) selenium transferase [Fimbriimonadaceae bacterium]
MAGQAKENESGKVRPPSVDQLARQINDDPDLHGYAVLAARHAIAMGGDFETGAMQSFVNLVGPSLRPVINLNGVVLHTGLGRARMADEAVDAISAASENHSSVEFDLESGNRGDRQEHVRWLLKNITGSEDALVVNNCAGAVVLALSAICAGSPVVLSRGQMVEIGGQFRMPDIIKMSGCNLVEIGCTNKTHLRDFESVMGEESGAFLRCHQSNFAQVGFVSQPDERELAELAHSRGWMMIDDLGSGCLVDTTKFGLPKERTLAEAVADGADLVLASGDKLLGGPQAGILVGSADMIQRCKRHPLARALRIDKLCLAGLEATLRLYFEGRETEVPVWASCSRDIDGIKKDCLRLKKAWGRGEVAEGVTELGGGSFPGVGVPTWRFGLGTGNEELAKRLRLAGIVGRIESGQIWLDPRTTTPDEIRETCLVLELIRENGGDEF